ncbi:sulfatase [Rubritalea marina]|uniref:sulfatase n=1 Tax=Rubritalea marina TaxID=361055 RepID=UPI00037A4980|nr:sulfatase [Rubritalea marina]
MNYRIALSLLLACSSLSLAATQPNIILICIDDLRPELPSFGKDYIQAPAIEGLAAEGRLFKRHYVQAPTCGASRFAMLTGLYPKTAKQLSNGAFRSHDHNSAPSFPAHLRSHGYLTSCVGKVSHYPGGFTGKNWNDKTKPELPGAWDRQPDCSGDWLTPQGLMHGYADGKARKRGKTPALEAAAKASYPDDAILDTFHQEIAFLNDQKKPWLCAVGLLRPHLPFACPKEFLACYDQTELPSIPAAKKPKQGEFWHPSAEFFGGYKHPSDPRNNAKYADAVRRHYAACVTYADSKVAEILETLESTGATKNTIIILWSDHGWHLGEQQIWGKHSPYHVALHAPLIIKTPEMLKPGVPSEAVVESIDIYPTLCELLSLPTPGHLEGTSLVKIVADPRAESDDLAIAHWGKLRSEIRSDDHQIINRKTNKTTQRYNLAKDPHESHNLAH